MFINNSYGILFHESNENKIINCTISKNQCGLFIAGSTKNTVFNCLVMDNNECGIRIWRGRRIYSYSKDNTISDCTNSNNYIGIDISMSAYDNYIYHNNFINNTYQANDSGKNKWDDGYPSGGNYWSDYIGIDLYYGEGQNISGSDRIGDTPYNISGVDENQDKYPLMHPSSWLDKTPPPISDLAPPSGTKTTKSTITISGKTESDAIVKINGVEVTVGSDGYFNKEITLVNGENIITITATDLAGNSKTETITITKTEKKEGKGLIPSFESSYLLIAILSLFLLIRRKNFYPSK